jgi:L,D-transpeptidase ErfK/SrfK
MTAVRARLIRMTLPVLALVLTTLPALGGGDLIGRFGQRVVRPGETLIAIAQEEKLGYVELLAANPGVDPWLPRAGTRLLLPAAHLLPDARRRGIVVNLGDLRLYFFPKDGGAARSFPLGIGRDGWETPTGDTKIVRKRAHPTWTPPASIRAEEPGLPACVAPGPDNPLGAYALNLGWNGYVIHGTNKPAGVGRRVSHGCIRLYPTHIAALFAAVDVGTPVTVVDQPVKLGWVGSQLYLEVHPTQAQVDEIEAGRPITPTPLTGITQTVRQAAGSEAGRVDWQTVRKAVRERRGIPIRITR